MDARDRLLSLVRAEPGASTTALADLLRVDDSTADYHLRRMQRGGVVVGARVGRELVWYANGAGFCPALRVALPAFRREGVARVALALDERPRTAADVAARAGLRVGEARWAAQLLEAAGFVERNASGRVRLRAGADVCVQKALARAPCGEWGRCAVSHALGHGRAS